MNDTTPTHCGHDPRYIVQADEGTAYCSLCELEAAQKELARLKELARVVVDDLDLRHDDCSCYHCAFAQAVQK